MAPLEGETAVGLLGNGGHDEATGAQPGLPGTHGADRAGGAALVPTASAATGVLASAWAFHVGVDRALGYGLKMPDAFRHTHLGWIGRGPVRSGTDRCLTISLHRRTTAQENANHEHFDGRCL